ncbi:MAG: porphobilinogen synthase [Bdellovibrionales bacterium]|nr:porphobilinogen synthase [Bdellovibrionales bacterium]
MNLTERPRRNRRNEGIRRMVRETELRPANLVYPLFLVEGSGQRVPVKSMPGVDRLSADLLVEEARAAMKAGVAAVALFPALSDSKKDTRATESKNPNGLLQTTVKRLKDALPELVVITDVAMDPYSTDGHDGLVKDGRILNDPTLEILAEMAVSQARAGADLVAPSDMMDGRVGFIRRALDQAGFEEVGILAYTAKYASAFYGPFRDALDSAPRHGDKKTYQMDPSNAREALREARLDVAEGADLVMVKPAGAYLDIIRALRDSVDVPVAAYQVSGEYAMIQAASANGWLNGDAAMMESLAAIRRAGADLILSYFARRAAELIGGGPARS